MTPGEATRRAIEQRDDPARHQDDSYGGCTVCRVWVWGEGDDEEHLPMPWPCPTVRLARLTTTDHPDVRAGLEEIASRLAQTGETHDAWVAYLTELESRAATTDHPDVCLRHDA
jgi:hypothetical protein